MTQSKTKRRDQGAGSLFYDETLGLWTARVELPSRDGKRRRKVVRARDKVVAAKKLKTVMAELAKAGDLPTSSPPLATFLARWLDDPARKTKPRTLATYRGYVDRYIAPEIGKIRLERLTPQHVRQVHARILDAGLSSTTALQAHRILAKALTDAMREGLVNRNVATLVDAPSRAVVERDALTVDQARDLLMSVASDPQQATLWTVALMTGLRQGERLGLTREAIDLSTDTITVSWQLQRLRWSHGCGVQRPDRSWPCGLSRAGSCPDRTMRIPTGQEARKVYGGLWLTRPKSRAGWRQVPIAPPLHDVLAAYLAITPPGDSGLIFHRDDGHPIDPRDDTHAWDTALKSAGLPDVVLHSARHTANTLLHSMGVDPETRQKIMGHSSAVVNATYVHVADPLMRDAMQRLGAKLAPQIEGA